MALVRHDMQHARPFDVTQVAEHGHQSIDIVAIDRAEVAEPQFLEQCARGDHALHVLLGAPGEGLDRRHVLQHFFGAFAHTRVEGPGKQPREILAHGADIPGDRHLVVIQDHQQVAVQVAHVVECLEGHAGGHRPVTDHGHVAVVPAGLGRSKGHAGGGADRGAGVPGAEGVVLTLVALGEAGDATVLPQGGHRGAATAQDLVRVGLVTHVPDDPVTGRVEYVMQRQGEFHGPQIGGQVSTGPGDGVDQELPQFQCDRPEIRCLAAA
jgi:hypothetical protein